MRTILTILLFTFLLIPTTGAQPGPPDHAQPIEGEILVKFAPDILKTPPQQLRPNELNLQGRQAARLRQLLNARRGRGQKVFRTFMPADTIGRHRQTGKRVRLIDLSRWYRFLVRDTTEVEALADRLKDLVPILEATPNYEISLYGEASPKGASSPQRFSLRTEPNDRYFDQQWGYHNPDTDADVDAPEAWSLNTGRNDVTVGVIDTGVDLDHSDLDPGDRSRVIQGKDFLGSGNPDDEDGHGTQVAGTLGARTDNGQRGVAGMMWDLRIIPLRVASGYKNAGSEGIAGALDYARSNGADIVNLSVGTGNPTSVVEDALYNAHASGLTVAVAAGNAGNNKVSYPASSPRTIAVGATNQNDRRCTTNRGCDFDSNYGPGLHLVAPSGFKTTKRGGDYKEFGGTSQAAPVVSGIAGLIRSESRDRNLGLTNEDIWHLMEQTADDVNSDQYPGRDDRLGHGRVNARKALEALQSPNDVVHATRSGGTGQKIDNNRTQVFHREHTKGQALANGTYIADVYRVTGHVSFSTSFVNGPPMVWARERSTTAWSNDNPNDQYPEVKVTNVTQNGFDYETYVYYVKTDVSGSYTINSWYPVSPSNVEIAYTAVGETDTPPLEASISGPTWLDTGEQGTWTASVSGGSGSTNYDWEYRGPFSTGWSTALCSGTSCSHTFYNYSSSQVEKAKIRVTVTKGSEQDQASRTVNVNPAGGYYSSVAKAGGNALQSLGASADGREAAAVRWATRGLLPAAEFIVEHRRDSTAAWTEVGRVVAADSVGAADRRRGASYRYRADGLSVGTHQFRVQVRRKGAKAAFRSRPVSAEIRLKEAYEVTTFPNPVRTQATVEVAVKERQSVTVAVYDVLGRRVTTLHEGPLPAQETQRFRLNASEAGLSSGTYFVRVTGAAFADARRLTVVR